MITATSGKIHWNYFIALERDAETISRYIEFCKRNFGVYSIALAHLLLAAASEVDVVAKELCKLISPNSEADNICKYRSILVPNIEGLAAMQIFVPRYGLTLTPWKNWESDKNPDWWGSYNNVKHHRGQCFNEATLKNAINALGALLILTYHYYELTLQGQQETPLEPWHTTCELMPESSLLRFPEDYYPFTL